MNSTINGTPLVGQLQYVYLKACVVNKFECLSEIQMPNNKQEWMSRPILSVVKASVWSRFACY